MSFLAQGQRQPLANQEVMNTTAELGYCLIAAFTWFWRDIWAIAGVLGLRLSLAKSGSQGATAATTYE